MKNLKASFLYWKLAIAKCSGKSLMAGMNTLAASLSGTAWSSFTPTEQFVAVCHACGASWLVMDAFLDQTMSRLSEADKKDIAKQTQG